MNVILMTQKMRLMKKKYPHSENFFLVVARKILSMLAIFCLLRKITNSYHFYVQTRVKIHIESGDIFCNDFNTKENFYNFLLGQQDECIQFTPKIIFCQYSFEKHTRNCLPSFSIDEIESSIRCQIKMLNTCCISLMTGLNLWKQNKY